MTLATVLALVGAQLIAAETPCAQASFDRNEIRLYSDPLAYEVVRDGQVAVEKTPIGLTMSGDGDVPAKQVKATTDRLSGTVATPVYKKSSVDLSGTETVADFGAFAVRLVARRDGVAYRFETKKGGKIVSERANVTVPYDARCWFNRTNRFGHEETVPEAALAGAMGTIASTGGASPGMFYLPFVYAPATNCVVAVTESDVRNYPNLYFGGAKKVAGGVELTSVFEKYPKTTMREGGWGMPNDPRGMERGGRWIRVTAHEDYLVDAPAPRTLPWRVFILADAPAKLCEADIVYALATGRSVIAPYQAPTADSSGRGRSPSAPSPAPTADSSGRGRSPSAPSPDFSWVKPGKVAWDWWNAFDNIGDPEGCTTKTYERFIDFAASNHVEYVIFDEGWSAKLDIWKPSPVVDVPYLIDYANRKGVGIILWMAWAQVVGEEEKVAAHFAKLGAKGFKVDFIDRADARATRFYEDFAKACAKHHMLVDYHGTVHPTGLQREYPNVVNYEAIHGLEQMKWGAADKDMPWNDVACVFLRMTAGPMDYTPGAMLNHPYGKYTAGPKHAFPGSVGTRAHQMAMMAAYEAPLQMLSDSPTHYEQNRECFDFMAKVPTVWADTVGLAGSPETYAVLARQAKDGSWYVAGLNNRASRMATVDTAFLGKGAWKLELFRDTDDGATAPRKYLHEFRTVTAGEKLSLPMVPGGGFALHFTR